MTIKSSNADGMREVFKAYCEVNKKADEELFVDQARKYATDVFEVYKEAAPTVAKITEDVKKQGWRIPQWMPGGRLGRGVPQNWLGLAWDKMQKQIGKRGRRTKKNHMDEETFMAQKPTLAQMQAFVIKYRVAARFSVAVGWVPAVLRFGGNVKGTSGRVGRGHGSATLTRTEGRLSYTFTNAVPHAAEEDQKHGLIAKAKARWRANAMVYIHRKIAEGLVRMHRASTSRS